METYYKVTNTSDTPILRDWIRAFLGQKDRAKYDEFKQSTEYTGATEEEKIARKRLPEMIKMRVFFNKLGKGVKTLRYEPMSDGTKRAEVEYKWCLAPDYDKILEDAGETDRNLYRVREICERHGIDFDEEDTVKNLVEKMKARFGTKNWVIMGKQQFEETGLADLEKKEIRQTLRPGELTEKIIYSGVLEKKSVLPDKAKEMLSAQKEEEAKLTPQYWDKEVLEEMKYKKLIEIYRTFGKTFRFGVRKVDLIEMILDEQLKAEVQPVQESE